METKSLSTLLIGMVLCVILYQFNITHLAETILLFSGIVVVPLILNLCEVRDRNNQRSWLDQLTSSFHPLFAVCLIVSFLAEEPTGILLAGGWLLYTVLIGINGVVRILKRGFLPLEELAIDISLLYLPLGGIWLLIYLTEWEIMNFSSTISLLTAIHFHYSSLVVPVFLGLLGRMTKRSRFYNTVLFLAAISPIAIAAGITFSPVLEFFSVAIFTIVLFVYAFKLLFHIIPSLDNKIAKGLFYISSLSILFSMILAIVYGYGEFTGKTTVAIDQMVLYHGITNAFGFSLAGAMGWTMVKPEPKYQTGIPFSQLMGKGRIGADFFERNLLTTDERKNGLVDNMEEFRSPEFHPELLPSTVRSFYENTSMYELLVYPDWKFGFRTALRIFKQISIKIQQMNFPLQNETLEEKMASRILSVNDELDGRKNVRAWIRTYEGTGLPIYAASYSIHSYLKQTYMNIAFPLPFCNLTSILRLYKNGKELVLTSLSDREKGDEGVYLVTRIIPIRLPINETIRVQTVNDASFRPTHPETSIIATHDMWLFGFKFLTLTYEIYRKK